MKNNFQSVFIAFILLTYGFLYATADYKNAYEPSDLDSSLFYILEAFVFVGVSLYGTITNNSTKDKNFKYTWVTLAVFFLIRLGWEIKAAISGVTINQKIGISLMFMADAIAALVIMTMPYTTRYLPPCIKNLFRKWQRSK